MAEVATVSIHANKSDGKKRAVCRVDSDGTWYLMVVTDGVRKGIGGTTEGPVFKNVEKGTGGFESCEAAAKKYGIDEVVEVHPQRAPKLVMGHNELERLGLRELVEIMNDELGGRFLVKAPASVVSKLFGFKSKRSRVTKLEKLKERYEKQAAKKTPKWRSKIGA